MFLEFNRIGTTHEVTAGSTSLRHSGKKWKIPNKSLSREICNPMTPSQILNFYDKSLLTHDFPLQNVLPQIFDEGATEDRGEMARLVSIPELQTSSE